MPIEGNANEDIKDLFSNLSILYGSQRVSDKPAFGDSMIERFVVTYASIDNKAEEPAKQEGRFVCELIVTEDMLNGAGHLHGGCSAFLVDICSTLCLMLFDDGMHVSQALNIVYHSPAGLGDKLRIVNTTMTVGARAMSARTEIWNATHHRLVATGVHIKMHLPSSKL
ncbi:HotDog domain-containing protein [Mycena crocata]|nr:HotDog domain-containing protein [Mycena crocata]